MNIDALNKAHELLLTPQSDLREIDFWIAKGFDWHGSEDFKTVKCLAPPEDHIEYASYYYPHSTSDVDDAIALIPKGLNLSIFYDIEGELASVALVVGDHANLVSVGNQQTLPLAICEAAINAIKLQHQG